MRLGTIFRLICSLGLIAPTLVSAAAPSADRLLPPETLAFFTLTDREQAAGYFTNSPFGLMWEDPALKPFKENFLTRGKEWLAPLERALGFSLTNFTALVGGQVTFAIIGASPGEGTNGNRLALILDVREKTNELKTMLDGLKQQWIASGKRIRNDVVRGVEFSTFFVGTEQFGSALRMVLPASDTTEAPNAAGPDEPEANQLAMTIGQSGSVLLAGTDLSTLGQISTRLTEANTPALIGLSEYQAVHDSLTRNALAYGWINAKALVKIVMDRASPAEAIPTDIPLAFRPEKLIEATGLAALESISMKVEGDIQGLLLEVLLRIPKAERRGLFKLIDVDPMDSAPPGFVPANAVHFLRWRWDGPNGWNATETMLKSISPELASVIETSFSLIGKEADINYDFRKNLVTNLGNDIIWIQPATNLVDPTSSPLASGLFLLASPNPDQLAGAFMAATDLLPVEKVRDESDFLGQKVYAVALPSDSPTDPARIYFATNQGYVVFSTARPSLERFLSEPATTTPSLQDRQEMIGAAQRVGGMSTGFFGYEDQVEFMRQALAETAERPAILGTFLNPIGEALVSSTRADEAKSWIDLQLLPPFARIAQYFHLAIYSGSSDRGGISLKYFLPTPPKLQ